MTENQRQELTLQDFGKLPLRALVGFVARCGRRLMPVLRQCAAGTSRDLALTRAETALALAESFAKDQLMWVPAHETLEQEAEAAAVESLGPGQFVVYATAHAAGAALLARRLLQSHRVNDAMELVATAFGSYRVLLSFVHGPVQRDLFTGDMVLRVVVTEFEHLQNLNLGRFGQAGQPMDVSEAGPLGPLWPEGPPSWYA